MKSIFWNIGEKLSKRKLELVSEAVRVESPDVFCIAEGSLSKKNCNKIINVFNKHAYTCYYSPLFIEKKELKLDYDYNGYGLKVFVRNDTIPKVPFTFSYQRREGRIVVLKAFKDYKLTTFIFLHNKSKVGDQVLDPLPFIFTIKEMIQYGKITEDSAKTETIGDTERVVIMGDFNIEPWENALKNKEYLNTSFFKNQNAVKKRSKNSEKHYFNPIVELILQSKIENLGGTHYTNGRGWALFDFILYNTKEGNIFFDIITKFDVGSKLLNEDKSIKKTFLNDGLDHLPIVAIIED